MNPDLLPAAHRSCPLCGHTVQPVGKLTPTFCSDTCLWTAHPELKPQPLSDKTELPPLTLEQRRELAWHRLVDHRQAAYDYSLLKPKAQAAGRTYAGYAGEHSLLITGASEAGKTYVAHRLARKAHMQGAQVVLSTAEAARHRWLGEAGEAYLTKLKTCQLLLLDDLGMENPTEGWRSACYELFAARENHGLPSVVTVNRTRAYYAEHYSSGLANRLWRMEVVEL